MTEATTIALDDELPWSKFDIPGGSAPVRMALLRYEPDVRARTLLVRFPAGWERPGAGFYESSEELLLLDGLLEISGTLLERRDWAFIPARDIRTAMRAHTDVLAFARFGGPARWVSGVEGGFEVAIKPVRLDPATQHARPSERLRDEADGRSWFGAPPAPGSTLDGDLDALDLDARVWIAAQTGCPVPRIGSPAFCRVLPHSEPAQESAPREIRL